MLTKAYSVILILFLYMLLASTFTIGKLVLHYVNPILFIGIRMTVAGLLLLGYAFIFDRSHWHYNRNHWWLWFKLTFFHIYCAFILEFIALKTVVSAKACLLYSISPFLTALFAYHASGERLTKNKWVGLWLGFMGLLPILITSAPAEGVGFAHISLAEILLLGSVVSAVYGWVLMKELLQSLYYSPVMANGLSMFFGGLAALLTSLFFEGMPSIAAQTGHDMGMFLVYLLLSIIIANIIFYNLYGYLLTRYSATFLSLSGSICPLFAALYGKLFLGESVSYPFFISLAAIGVGLYLFYKEELKRDVPHKNRL